MAVKNKSKNEKKKLNISFSPFLKVIVKLLFPLSVIGGGLYISIQLSDVWNEKWPVNKIALEGENTHVSHLHLLELLAENNTGMLTIDLEELREEALLNPWVKNIEIKKQWPETLVFSVDEYLPIALVNNRYLLESGQLVEIKELETLSHLLNLEIDKTQLEQIDEPAKFIVELNAVDQDFLSRQLVIDRFVIDDANSWSVELENKVTINIGRKYQQKRIERFLKVYPAIEDKQLLQSVDLRYSNGLAVKLIKNSAEVKQNG